MPKNSKVGRCASKVVNTMPKGQAIATCQKSTGQAYATGKKPKSKSK